LLSASGDPEPFLKERRAPKSFGGGWKLLNDLRNELNITGFFPDSAACAAKRMKAKGVSLRKKNSRTCRKITAGAGVF